MFVVNAVGQLYLLNYLLGAENLGVHFSMFGLHIFRLLMAGLDVGENSMIFPRITMCDFTIRQFSNLQDYTVECSLPINLFSEKFFIFLWFWIVFVFFANIYSFLSWLWSIFTVSKINYVKKYVKLVERVDRNTYDKKHIACFAEEYLRHDGIFYLRMLAANANDVIVAQMIACLWRHYKSEHMYSKEYHKHHPKLSDDLEDGSGAGLYDGVELDSDGQPLVRRKPASSFNRAHGMRTAATKRPSHLKFSTSTKATATMSTKLATTPGPTKKK